MVFHYISPRAKIGKNVKIGANVIILGPSEIGDNTIIDSNVIIGYPIKANLIKIRETTKDYLEFLDLMSSGAKIGKNAIIRSGTVIYENTEIGDNLETGHNVLIREKTKIGENVKIGTGTIIDGRTEIGDNVNIQSNVYIPLLTKIGNNVFIGPGAIFLNDKYPPSKRLIGVTVEDDAVIGGGAVILPGVKIGKEAVIGAGCVVTKNVPESTVVVGNPARCICSRSDYEKRKKLYEEQRYD